MSWLCLALHFFFYLSFSLFHTLVANDVVDAFVCCAFSMIVFTFWITKYTSTILNRVKMKPSHKFFFLHTFQEHHRTSDSFIKQKKMTFIQFVIKEKKNNCVKFFSLFYLCYLEKKTWFSFFFKFYFICFMLELLSTT